jgi:hypothetical protein
MKPSIVVLLVSSLAQAAPAVRVVSPMVQVFPSSVPAGEPAAKLEAARGEWEPFQIVVHADDAGLKNVRAMGEALDGGGAAILPSLFRVAYLDVKTPSSVEGKAGPWPDALVPDVDGFVHEKRRAFPFDVPPHESRSIWVELFVPEAAAAGVHRGQITIAADGQPNVAVPIELTVHAFALPKSSSLPVTYGHSLGAIAKGHPGAGDVKALMARYGVAALRHRISLHGGTMDAPDYRIAGGKMILDFAAYDAEVGPFLDGNADRGGPADGARWTALEVRIPQKLDGKVRADYTRAMVAHLKERGWLARAFDYVIDEPTEAQFAELQKRASVAKADMPEVPRLVTHAFDARLAAAVDIWCPVVNLVDDKPSNSTPPPREKYRRLWWYQSCMSHGCNIVGGDYFTGWPSMAIDAPAMSHRILEWLSFRYRVQGELYYDTVAAYATKDPWRDQLLFGGNGDGTLFYPGRASIIGGKTDVPVESIRLALVREGLEDYEWLTLYAKAAGPREAEALARSLADKTYRWEHDDKLLYAARRKMAPVIDAWWKRQLASGGDSGVNAR